MKRGSKIKKFHRTHAQRKAFIKGLATGLIENGRIETTLVRAKELSRIADRLVTRAKKQDTASRRLLARHLGPKAIKALIDDVAPRFTDRPGGYTRVVKLGQRTSDSAPMAMIEFVEDKPVAPAAQS